jgi:hypothetical protein
VGGGARRHPVRPGFRRPGEHHRGRNAVDPWWTAHQINPPKVNAVSPADYPNQVDPRGLATFGLVGLGFAVLGTVMRRVDAYPRRLSALAVALGALMIVIYLGRLIILDPTNPVVRLALAAGVVANTVFLVWLGSVWRRGRPVR